MENFNSSKALLKMAGKGDVSTKSHPLDLPQEKGLTRQFAEN